MNLVADESIDAPIVATLRSDGHEVAYVAEMHPGISDDDVLGNANKTQCPLLTGDKDFGELVFRLHRISHLEDLGKQPSQRTQAATRFWRRCRVSCSSGIDVRDHRIHTPWILHPRPQTVLFHQTRNIYQCCANKCTWFPRTSGTGYADVDVEGKWVAS